MSVKVKIPTQLRSVAGGEGEVDVDGAGTVGEALEQLFERHGELRERMLQDGELQRFVNVYLDGEDVRFLDGLATPVPADSELTILPAVAGG